VSKVIKQAILLLVLSVILGLGVNFRLVQRYFQGEFQHGFLSSERYPSIAFITLEEAEELFAGGEALFVDSRPEQEFILGHIFGALSVPMERINRGEITIVDAISFERTLVVYCDGSDCQSSVELARWLHDQGFTDIRVFFGGWAEWTNQGLPDSQENDTQ
jgi:rhodanese-related sulfurtransferase